MIMLMYFTSPNPSYLSGFGVWGWGFWVWGLGFGVWGLGFRVQGLGCRVYPVDEHDRHPPAPRSSKYGTYKPVKAIYKTVKATNKTVKTTYKPVKARIWPWLSGKSPENIVWCSLFARKRL